jgi:hypothetical protein
MVDVSKLTRRCSADGLRHSGLRGDVPSVDVMPGGRSPSGDVELLEFRLRSSDHLLDDCEPRRTRGELPWGGEIVLVRSGDASARSDWAGLTPSGTLRWAIRSRTLSSIAEGGRISSVVSFELTSTSIGGGSWA